MQLAFAYSGRNKSIRWYSFGHALRDAWADEKKRVADEEARNAEKEAMKAALSQPVKRSSYDDLSIPVSAYYTNNNKGRFGSCFVGD